MAEGLIVVGLDGEGGIVGGSVEKGGFCEIKEDWLLSMEVSQELFQEDVGCSYCYLNAKSLPSSGHVEVIARGPPLGRNLG